MNSANPWENAFKLDTGTARLNSNTYFDELLTKEDLEKKDKPETFIQFDDTGVGYTVNTSMKTIECRDKNIACNPPLKRTYVRSNYDHFFDSWLQNATLLSEYITKTDHSYHINKHMNSRYSNLYNKITDIFKQLPPAIGTGGSRRHRRPSRKYKKSKRVLRRKSRSMRRR